MDHKIRIDADLGHLLCLSNGKVELEVTLDIGIRIVHLSCCGMKNLYYRQPSDLSDGIFREHGWRLIGGHRFWIAPESEESYWADNLPVQYALSENGVTLTQQFDPWIGIEKAMHLEFLPDGTILVEHIACNRADSAITGSLWGINTLAGGTGEIEFIGSGKYSPTRTVTLWRQTNLADSRLTFSDDLVRVSHKPLSNYFKIGVYSSSGRIVHHNYGQELEIQMQPASMDQCADGGVNVEVYMNRNFMELETLGPLTTISPGASVTVREIWRIQRS